MRKETEQKSLCHSPPGCRARWHSEKSGLLESPAAGHLLMLHMGRWSLRGARGKSCCHTTNAQNFKDLKREHTTRNPHKLVYFFFTGDTCSIIGLKLAVTAASLLDGAGVSTLDSSLCTDSSRIRSPDTLRQVTRLDADLTANTFARSSCAGCRCPACCDLSTRVW